MPRKKLIRTNQFPYHICSRTNNQQWFRLPLPEVWSYALKSLNKAQGVCPIQLHAFVLMNNHYHLVLSTPDSNIDQFMFHFNKTFADKLRVHSKRINRIFGGPYCWSLISSQGYFYNVMRYVFQNPLRAELVDKAEDYPFSSLHYEVKQLNFPLVIYSKLEFPFTENKLLDWINYQPSTTENSFIRKGLRKSSFSPSKDSNTGKTYELSHFLTQIS